MIQISAVMVKQLREKTDAPMMECKKALSEANGNMIKAEEILRIKLGLKASKTASRLATEGLIGYYISNDNKVGVLVEINCETDFVTKNDEFISFTNKIAQIIAIHNPNNIDELSKMKISDNLSVNDMRLNLIAKIGENISIRRFNRMETNNQIIGYVHNSRLGALVTFDGDINVAKDIAMHIVANKPKALDIKDVNSEDVEFERTIAEKKAKDSGKPVEIIKKIIDGSINKFLKEITLLNQAFIKDENVSVKLFLQTHNTKIYNFSLYIVGDGFEKKENNFADEVALTVANIKK
ncbi:Elongation factor Ts [Candidatus Kinetoplastibacterium sorsogonicusi]|uniref:Elongation factor Ts n=1 Tax=Candidatus Kinetoplastidibacterium kentomonadis TaxID=1576550 RepID=A0A3Q8ERA7_9PROT|nr:translation elongation factor Ts [Candidatus Kinetoplastibacterium sorsogonicusi]AWD32425.1 Elongation factor Ts [Candidatus Kinetoplastibacterium sorsogonicusi]